MPVRAHLSPVALVVPVQGAVSVQMQTNSPVTAPSPHMATVQTMVVVIPPPKMPVSSDIDPLSSSPPSVDPVAVTMAANSLVAASPEPAWALVVVVFAPKSPVLACMLPLALDVDKEAVQSIAMNTDTTVVVCPNPLPLAMMAMIVVVASDQVPILSNDNPPCASPAFQDAQAVQVAANATVAAPEPSVRSIVMFFPPQMPV